MHKILFILCSLLLLTSCNSKPQKDPELKKFVTMLAGHFSSVKQSKEDSGYANVNLINTSIWKEKDGFWMYQELFNEKDSLVYLQRILNIKRKDSSVITVHSYRLPEAKLYLNGWKDPEIFNKLSVDSLIPKKGCQVDYKRNTASIFIGKTKGKNCKSSFRKGMDYPTSNIVISQDKITSWDRGYDKEGKQVYGKLQGPYKYRRVK